MKDASSRRLRSRTVPQTQSSDAGSVVEVPVDSEAQSLCRQGSHHMSSSDEDWAGWNGVESLASIVVHHSGTCIRAGSQYRDSDLTCI